MDKVNASDSISLLQSSKSNRIGLTEKILMFKNQMKFYAKLAYFSSALSFLGALFFIQSTLRLGSDIET